MSEASDIGARLRGARSIGLVLGGGGMPGIAYHVGTLLALEVDHGWDPRSADVVVGTSAGSVVGSLLRAGLDTDDLAAWAAGVPARDDRDHVREAIDRVDRAGLRLSAPWLRTNPAGSWGNLVRAALDVGVLDGAAAIAEAQPLFGEWPAERLLITAVRTVDGSRMVFGRDLSPTVSRAVAASCAIPLVFRPVRVAGELYVDGGVRSPTNADVLVGEGVDLAVILSPMTSRAVNRRPAGVLRAWTHARLASEVRRLNAAGVDTLVLQPNAATQRAGGWNVLSRARVGDVLREAFLSTADH